ncbi:MAG: hypothetical protein ACP5K9_01420 [Candidatus Micrarchaeia archaeon]
MANIVSESFSTYAENIRFVLLFSIPFAIAFLIPMFAPLPTYLSAGAIFLRSASISMNMSAVSLAVIVISLFVSLLFISFAFVAISLIVKAKKTYKKTPSSVLKGIERYISKVFVVLLVYALALIIANFIGYYAGAEAAITSIVGFFGFIFIFYVPSAIVVEDKRIGRAFKDNMRLMARAPQYFVIWLLLAVMVVSILDYLLVHITGTLASEYLMLVINSIVVLPYFVIFQAEAYMRKFPLLSH